jgi:hypothetical protein
VDTAEVNGPTGRYFFLFLVRNESFPSITFNIMANLAANNKSQRRDFKFQSTAGRDQKSCHMMSADSNKIPFPPAGRPSSKGRPLGAVEFAALSPLLGQRSLLI